MDGRIQPGFSFKTDGYITTIIITYTDYHDPLNMSVHNPQNKKFANTDKRQCYVAKMVKEFDGEGFHKGERKAIRQGISRSKRLQRY